MNSFENRLKRALKMLRYLWAHFHNYFLTTASILLVFLYYLYCTFSRYHVDTDIYIGNLINSNDNVFSSHNFSHSTSKSLVKFGTINNYIDKKKYKEAIELLEGVKTMVGERTMLYKYLTVRQCLLSIHTCSNRAAYERYLKNNQLLLGKDAINSLISTYELCRED